MFAKLKQNQANKKKRLVYNAFFSSLSWLLPLILGFLVTPIILQGLGYDEYGLYTLILGIISYSFTFGIGRAVTKYVSEYRNQGRTEKISEIISATFWFSILLGIFGIFAIVLCSDVIVRDILLIQTEKQTTAVNSLFLASATIAFLMIGQVFQAIVQAVHRFDRNSLLLNLNGFLLTIGNIVLVYSGFGLNTLLSWNLFVTGLNCLLFYHSAKIFLPDFHLSFQISRESLNLVLGYGIGVIGYQILGNIILIFERSWIIRNLGAESLTFYVVPMQLALYFHGFISSIILVIFPLFSELRDDREKLISLYQKATKIVLAAAVFAILTIICGGNLFLSLWINDELAAKSYPLLIIHFLSFGVLAVFTVVWQLAEGFGRPRFNALIAFIWLVISIPLMVLFVPEQNISGAGLARLSGILATVPFIFYGEKIFLGAIQTKFWASNILIISIAAVLSFLTERVLFNLLGQNWFVFIAGTVCGAIVYIMTLWTMKFVTEEEKGLIREFL